MLHIIDHLPEGLLDLPAQRVHEKLSGPTLIHLKGLRDPPLFASVLLHGNEDTGWEAVRRLLKRASGKALARSLSLFIGNVSAARCGLRRFDGQPDYNRIWPGGDDTTSAEAQMMQQVFNDMALRGIFASIDIHNNTGNNPHYACINALDGSTLHLAQLFSRTVVYFTRPRGVVAMAMASLAPSVTVECGLPGQKHGTEHALEYIDACLSLPEIPASPARRDEIDLFHTVAIVTIPERVSFGFGDEDVELCLIPRIDRLNFREVSAGTYLGSQRASAALALETMSA